MLAYNFRYIKEFYTKAQITSKQIAESGLAAEMRERRNTAAIDGFSGVR